MNYPHKCKVCRANARYKLCSNYKCKSWKILRRQARSVNIIHGLSADDPIQLYCPNCKTKTALGGSGVGADKELHNMIYCVSCKKDYPFIFDAGLWYRSNNKHSYFITQYLGNDIWDYNNELCDDNKLTFED